MRGEDRIRVADGEVIEGNALSPARTRACRDQDKGSLQQIRVTSLRDDSERVRVDERSGSTDDFHAVSFELVGHYGHFIPDDLVLPSHKILEGQAALQRVGDMRERAELEAVQKIDRILERLAGQCPGVDSRAAEGRFFLDDRHALPELRCLNSGLLSAWAAADHQHVILGHLRRSSNVSASPEIPARTVVRNPSGHMAGCLLQHLRGSRIDRYGVPQTVS